MLSLPSLQTADDGDEAAGHKNFISTAMQTGFCDWSARYFAQPVMKVREPWLHGAQRSCPFRGHAARV